MDQVFSSSSSASPTPLAFGMTDVVEVVRRRTIITLGPRMVAPSGGSSSIINVTLAYTAAWSITAVSRLVKRNTPAAVS